MLVPSEVRHVGDRVDFAYDLNRVSPRERLKRLIFFDERPDPSDLKHTAALYSSHLLNHPRCDTPRLAHLALYAEGLENVCDQSPLSHSVNRQIVGSNSRNQSGLPCRS